ncbi:putative nucleotide-binding alpha-beta plait domain superfamily, RNA-binding domain superfamily [Helianthus annuus]|nr:putative nucleotide-binding alpha-beta plait domain superfamily, RNA-binding domain superfamily [Helianthus annuus]
MQRFGEVWKSYVAKKRDKSGNRFGFISFKSVSKWKDLEKKINGVNIGGCKLKVNVARFAVENNGMDRESDKKKFSEGESDKKGKAVGQGVGAFPQEGPKSFGMRGVRSYRDVVNPTSAGLGPSGSVLSPGGCRTGRVVMISEEVSGGTGLYRRAVVGRTVDLDTLVIFDRLLRIGKVDFLRIQYLGGLSILVSFANTEAAELFLQNKVLWGPWFSKLDLWEGQVLAVERIAWHKIHGLPFHIFDPEVLRKIGDSFGKTLYVTKDVGEESDLSVNRVAVLAGNDNRVEEFVCLKWRDKTFRVWVKEEDEV